MKKKFSLFCLCIFTFMAAKVFAYELVLPVEKKSEVSSEYAFFVGHAKRNESLTINGERIYMASNGAFAHSVKLKEGENRIIVKSNYKTQVYKIYKKKYLNSNQDKLVEYEEPVLVVVKKNNTPLRNTPVDAGLNRISHLFEGTEVVINGEKGQFYRVFLSKDEIAWISKNDVKISENSIFKPAEFITADSNIYKNARVQMISFDKKLPYTIDDSGKEILFSVYNSQLLANSVYKITIPKPEKYTYSVNLSEGEYKFKVNELPKDIEEITVAIDAGHGGRERGAIGCLGDAEKDINMKIAFELKQQLKQKGFNVVMIRECDANIELQDRVDFAKVKGADIFVSVHLNSIPDIEMNVHKNKGTSVYYFNENSKHLAEIVKKTTISSISTRDDGVRTASFAVICPTEYIGILVEAAYMTNPQDSVIYTGENFAKNTARGIADGIYEFVTK